MISSNGERFDAGPNHFALFCVKDIGTGVTVWGFHLTIFYSFLHVLISTWKLCFFFFKKKMVIMIDFRINLLKLYFNSKIMVKGRGGGGLRVLASLQRHWFSLIVFLFGKKIQFEGHFQNMILQNSSKQGSKVAASLSDRKGFSLFIYLT